MAGCAVVIGLPTLGGGFVGGDDHRLALNHVFVNHPSFSHALKLFTIPHRDLYQPLPLLTFSIEFALAQAFDLFRAGPDAAGWLFHLNNVWLHALNAVLVWFVVMALHGRVMGEPSRSVGRRGLEAGSGASVYAVATVAALMFAVHPLQVEVIAWLNGRMMLLSTLFGLVSLLSFCAWLEKKAARYAVLTVVFVVLCSISKVRIGLPVLLAITAFAHTVAIGFPGRTRPLPFLLAVVSFVQSRVLDRRTWVAWGLCVVVTGVFVLVNIQSTAGVELFEQGAEHLRGPRLVRVMMALAFYFEHLLVPVGLASYYPTPPVVYWSDAETWRAAGVVVVALGLMGWACRYRWPARLGTLWFFATIFSTLPLFPARNILAADRYLYLPMVGLAWMAGDLAVLAYRRWLKGVSRPARVGAVGVVGAAVVAVFIGIGWHVGRFYSDPVSKTRRIASLFPDTPRVWEPLGWSLLSEGEYRTALKCAEMELRHTDAPNVMSGGYQLRGMARLRLGQVEEGLADLHRAIEADPDNALARYRLAKAYDELGRVDEALRYYEEAAEAAPKHNPTLTRLARLHVTAGNVDRARALYAQALENNPYDVTATMGLAELEIDTGTRGGLLAAETRLRDLLEWMPENNDARTNLGVVLNLLGQGAAAIEAYQEVLRRDPGHVTAALNLAELHQQRGEINEAGALFIRLAQRDRLSVEQAKVVHDFLVGQGRYELAVGLWERMGKVHPGSAEAKAFLAWSHALDGRVDAAERVADGIDAGDGTVSPSVQAALAFVTHAAGRSETAAAMVRDLDDAAKDAAIARRRLLAALEQFDRARPGVGWTFCLAGRLLLFEGNREGARMSVSLCEAHCDDPACEAEARLLRERVEG